MNKLFLFPSLVLGFALFGGVGKPNILWIVGENLKLDLGCYGAKNVRTPNLDRLAAEGEICWAGMHSWKDMLDLLEGVGMPETLGFQADLAHTYLYLMGYNAPEHALLQDGHSEEEFYSRLKKVKKQLVI